MVMKRNEYEKDTWNLTLKNVEGYFNAYSPSDLWVLPIVPYSAARIYALACTGCVVPAVFQSEVSPNSHFQLWNCASSQLAEGLGSSLYTRSSSPRKSVNPGTVGETEVRPSHRASQLSRWSEICLRLWNLRFFSNSQFQIVFSWKSDTCNPDCCFIDVLHLPWMKNGLVSLGFRGVHLALHRKEKAVCPPISPMCRVHWEAGSNQVPGKASAAKPSM